MVLGLNLITVSTSDLYRPRGAEYSSTNARVDVTALTEIWKLGSAAQAKLASRPSAIKTSLFPSGQMIWSTSARTWKIMILVRIVLDLWFQNDYNFSKNWLTAKEINGMTKRGKRNKTKSWQTIKLVKWMHKRTSELPVFHTGNYQTHLFLSVFVFNKT